MKIATPLSPPRHHEHQESPRNIIFLSHAAIIVGIAVVMLAGSCKTKQEEKEILVSAAVSLKEAFEEIGSRYEHETGIRPRFNFGASGVLEKQVESGAPVDVFASASSEQMDGLERRGLIASSTRRNLARNDLVIVTPKTAEPQLSSFEGILSVKRLAIGNPRTVPAGQYAQDLLERMALWDQLRPRMVFAENVRQVLDYVMRGEVEAGIVYASDATIAGSQVNVSGRAPKDLQRPILYPIAVVRDSRRPAEAARFIDNVLGKTGQDLLRKHGFLSPQ